MPHAMEQMTEAMRQGGQACLDCYAQCLETVQHGLMLGGTHAEQRHIGAGRCDRMAGAA